MLAPGMITRHFDHESGATATLEMPAGWSRNCYYISTTYYRGSLAPEIQRQTFASPDEARQKAVERERQALANGWRPRMAARATPATEAATLYRPTGEKIGLRVKSCSMRIHRASSWGGHEPRLESHEFDIRAQSLGGDGMLTVGDRVLIRMRDGAAEIIAAAFINDMTALYEPLSDFQPYLTVDIRAVQTALEPGEQTAIERWHDREAVIGDLIDDPDPSLKHLWEELSKRVQTAADRANVQQEILRRRSERQASEARAIEDRRTRERMEAERAVRDAAARVAASNVPLRPVAQRQVASQQATEAAIRRLTGGQDLSKPKRRKIDLGE